MVCEPPPPVFEGMYNCTRGFELDSQCILNCEPQRQQVSGWGGKQRSVKHCASEHPKRCFVATPGTKCHHTTEQKLPCKYKDFLLGISHSKGCTTAWGWSPASWRPFQKALVLTK